MPSRRRHNRPLWAAAAALTAVAAVLALAALPAATAAPVPPPPAIRTGSSRGGSSPSRAPPPPPPAAKKPTSTISPALAAAVAAAAAAKQAQELAGVVDASACPPYVAFFPPGAEEFNVPSAWGMSRQRQAGNPYPDRLLPVVMSSVNAIPGSVVATPPTLQLAVSHPLLGQPGTFVNNLGCMGVRGGGNGGSGGGGGGRQSSGLSSGAITRRRSLLQQAGYLSKPATYSITWSLNGTAPSTRTFEPTSTEKPRIMLPELQTMPDGHYCLQFTVTIQPWTGLVGQSQAVPIAPLYVTKRVCFVKLDQAINADVSFDGCGAPFSMLVANVSLPAIPLVPGNPNAGILGITALKVRAYLNRTDDSSGPVPEGAKRELTKWFLLDRPLPSNAVLRYRPAEADTPVPGWYNVDTTAYIATNRPGLISLPTDEGVFPLNDPNVPAPLRGLPFFSAGVASTNVTGNLVPLQAGPTRAFTEMIGPEEYLANQNGAQVQFTWKTEGFGPTYCFQGVEGGDDKHRQPAIQRINDDKGRCRSPFDTHLNQVDTNETLSLSFTDACGDLYAKQVEFGKFGWRTVREILPPPRRGRSGIDVDADGSPLGTTATAGAAQPAGGWGAGGAEFDAGNATVTVGVLGGAGFGNSGGLLQQARHRRGRGEGRNGAVGSGTGAAAGITAAAAAALAVLL